jgi:hypothetical protein
MTLSKERIDEFKEIYKKENGKEMSDQEASDVAHNLVGFVELIWELSQKHAKLDQRLKKEPEGFPVDGNYSCLICHNSITEVDGWYHWGGPRCLICHKAIKDGVIPTFVLEGRDSYFSKWQLEKFGIKPQSVKKYIREGKLKPRTVLCEDGTTHVQIFLKKENPEFIERYNPARKSYDRNRAKVSERWARKLREEMREERAKWEKKWKKLRSA